MQTLTRMRLINWHRFHNETINFGDSVLVSGENGAGKSTLLDAIQFVITASKNHFNKAAHENGKRKLSGYVRCKTGKENKPYERTGQVTAHIALEFYDESRKTYYIVGAVVDSASEDSDVCVWYRMEDVELSDDLFLQGNAPKTIDSFRTSNKKYVKMIDRVQANVRKDFKGRFGRLDSKFFDLIPKSLAFKPIDDIKDFVYTCVLDEKEVNIEALRENVRTYQELELLLKTTRIKLEKLENICGYYEKVTVCIKKDSFYEYYIARADLDINRLGILAEKKNQERENLRLEELKGSSRRLEADINGKRQIKDDLTVELRSDQSYVALGKVMDDIVLLEGKIAELEDKKKNVLKYIRSAVKRAEQLVELLEDSADLVDVTNLEDSRDLEGSKKKLEQEVLILKRFLDIFTDMEKCQDFTGAKEAVEDVKHYKEKKAEIVRRNVFKCEGKLEKENDKLKEVNRKIENLSNKKLDYGMYVTKLQGAIKEELVRLGRSGDVRVLCELLNIIDEKWKNAIEGYLNTQKFYLLVEPEDFDVALSVYERLKESQGMYGAGVINVAKLEAYDSECAGSLATKVTSKSIYAKRFVNMILNDVVMCEKTEQLKQYKKAITPSCVRYQNHVAVVMNPKTYEVPFIGENAYKIQLEQARAEQGFILGNIKKEEAIRAELLQIKGLLSYDEEVAISYEVFAIFNLRLEKEALKKANEQKKQLEANSTLMLKQVELERIAGLIKNLETELLDNQKWQGACINAVRESVVRENTLIELEKELDKAVDSIEEGLGTDSGICKAEYEKRSRDREPSSLKANYESTKKGNLTRKFESENEMISAMSSYKSEHDFGAEASLKGYRAFEELFDKLRNSELLSYEEKVQRAKVSAEEEFREQFLSKLQENIKKAQGEFSQLNKALKTIPFGSDYYKFEYSGSKNHKMYYDMIMDDFNVIEGVSLLSSSFNDRHREVIEELFSKLTAEGDNSEKILKEFTDYRTYMDYDIRIDHGNDEFSYYSKVCEEKSGGETQTPFYVTMAASFVQLYSSGIGGEAIGLILLDEAFNNMDDERIAGVLEFFKQLPLQMIIAAPPDKIQYIQPSVKKTLLVLKEGESSYVEGFAYEKL